MIIHCTKKLAAKLTDVSATLLSETSPMGSWHANLYTLYRRQCAFFCHDITRYVLFLPGLVKADFAKLDRLHREIFLATLATQGVGTSQMKRVELSLGPMRFDNVIDRSVLGSMNIAWQDLEYILMDKLNPLAIDPVKIALRLNERPATASGKWLWPNEEMMELVSHL
jgi:hypothetical protein